MWKLTDGFLVMEVFAFIPIITITFLAFLGIWARHDYKMYMKKKTQLEINEE